MDLATSATPCGLRPPVTWLAARRGPVDQRALAGTRVHNASQHARADSGRRLEFLFRGVFGSITPCEGGAMVSFCAVMTCANGASEPGNGVVSARTRHGETGRADTRALLHRAIRYLISTNRPPRGPATNPQMPGLFRSRMCLRRPPLRFAARRGHLRLDATR
jgi:hypothetical protein